MPGASSPETLHPKPLEPKLQTLDLTPQTSTPRHPRPSTPRLPKSETQPPNPKPQTPDPKPQTPDPPPQTPNPQPWALNSKPQATRHPKLETPDPALQTLESLGRRVTRHPKPETPGGPKPETPNNPAPQADRKLCQTPTPSLQIANGKCGRVIPKAYLSLRSRGRNHQLFSAGRLITADYTDMVSPPS